DGSHASDPLPENRQEQQPTAQHLADKNKGYGQVEHPRGRLERAPARQIQRDHCQHPWRDEAHKILKPHHRRCVERRRARQWLLLLPWLTLLSRLSRRCLCWLWRADLDATVARRLNRRARRQQLRVGAEVRRARPYQQREG